MKKHFNTWWLRHTWIGAMTLGSHVFFKRPENEVSERIIRHEYMHVEQVKRLGVFRFYTLYLWYTLLHGYKRNPLEVEARNFASSPWKTAKGYWTEHKETWED